MPIMQHFLHPPGLPPGNGYSHAVAFSGTMVAVSGQIPVDQDGNVVGDGDARAQTRQVFANLRTALGAAGARLDQVVKLTIFLTDIADLPVFREVRDEFLDLERPPACSLVQVSGLVNPAFRVEIDALAAI
jgi:reactive intermediate/imine deaminase